VFLFVRLLRESVLFAYQSVISNKLRTFLTLLGITIGIFAIISVFTILDSMEAEVRNSISSLGENVVRVEKWPWLFGPNYPWWEFIKRPEANLNDYREIKQRSKLSDVVCFSSSVNRSIKNGSNYIESVTVMMNTHEYFDIKPIEFEKGRYFTPFESELGRNCCVVGFQIANQLFPNQDPVGKEIKMAGHKLTIIGVARKMGSDIVGESLDEAILIPFYYGRQLFDLHRIGTHIKVRAMPGVSVTNLMEELRMIIRSERRLGPMEKDNFALNQASVLSKMFDTIFGVIDLAGWIIGGFSILVGGFGIANIMFVSVKERTHIIGIQKACGAKKYVILVQFLFEAMILSLAGGIIGLLMVFGGTLLVNSSSDFTIVLTVGNVVRGLVVSGVIGIVSGFAPAWTAARLNPVEAINTHF
jgi:putative ABC transport system permease protein